MAEADISRDIRRDTANTMVPNTPKIKMMERSRETPLCRSRLLIVPLIVNPRSRPQGGLSAGRQIPLIARNGCLCCDVVLYYFPLFCVNSAGRRARAEFHGFPVEL